MLATVEDPIEKLLEIGFQGTQNLAMRIAIDLDLFTTIEERTSLDELTTKTGAERILLFRILRLLVATDIILEPEPDFYSATAVSRTLRAPPLRDWIKATYDTLMPIWVQTSAFIKKNGYRDISDTGKNPTLEMYGHDLWQQLARHPEREADFMSAMKLQDLAPKERLPQFPYSESFSSFEASVNEGESDVFMVDVGGGNGQYLDRLIKEHPELPGRKIFQDLPTIIARADPTKTPAEPMAHDFFMPQPVKGAKYYHLRGILHDWPDRECVEILKQLQPGFKPGYSRLLIQTYVLPEVNCTPVAAMQDINMWTCCGIERNESQWVKLLESTGFHVRRIVKAEVGLYAIIEAEL